MQLFIDSHAHLSMLLARNIEPISYLDALFLEGFGGILDIGTEADDLVSRISQFGKYERVRFSAGIWPSAQAIADRNRAIKELEKQIDAAPAGSVVAIGEAGLDRHWNHKNLGAGERGTEDLEGERDLFELQVQLAFKKDLPLIVHSRDAGDETIQFLTAFTGLRAVIHCFSYELEEAKQFLDLGFYLSFAGTVTYPSANAQREAARYVPLDRLLIETDAPYLAPVPHRGKAAVPGMVASTYEFLAKLRNEPLDTLLSSCAAINSELFGF
ncbi:TatD family hydrolase [Treponema sp.]